MQDLTVAVCKMTNWSGPEKDSWALTLITRLSNKNRPYESQTRMMANHQPKVSELYDLKWNSTINYLLPTIQSRPQQDKKIQAEGGVCKYIHCDTLVIGHCSFFFFFSKTPYSKPSKVITCQGCVHSLFPVLADLSEAVTQFNCCSQNERLYRK